MNAYAASVITAVIAQKTRGVRRVEPVAPDMVEAQIDALADDLPPAAIKVGLLAQAETVRRVARRLARLAEGHTVIIAIPH